MLHLDIKKLGRFLRPGHRVTGARRGHTSRGVGWDFVHVCIDDHSRVSYVEILPDERKESVVAFFQRAKAYYESLGVRVEQVMTDNGSAYRSRLFNRLLDASGIRHLFTRPLHPVHEGQGGTLYPDRPARVGLRPSLSHIAPESSRPVAVVTRLQLAPTAWQSQSTTTRLSTGPLSEQPS